MRKVLYLSLLSGLLVLGACHKHKDDGPDGPPADGSTLDKIRDSIYLYTKECYYWHDALPGYSTFQPRNFSGSTDLASLQSEVNALSQYKINPATNQPFEYVANSNGAAKYSFIDGGQTSTSLGGARADFGLAITAIADQDLRVRYVYPGSPAGVAGLKRGEQIIKINDKSNPSFNNDYNYIVSALGASPINLTLRRGDGSTYTATLSSTAYTTNPVMTYKVINQSADKIVGYMAFNTFTTLSNAKPKLDEAFNYFTQQKITDLVVDLRYNGGGVVATAEYLCDLIVPTAKNNTLMYNTYFNDVLAANQTKLLANQWRRDANNKPYNYSQIDFSVAGNAVNFAKVGSLNINRVFFIVTGSTASASELTINNLRPHMDVKLIGRNTYGKPVGFFDININKYQLYVPEFETKNSANQGGYYTGMTPGSTDYPGKLDADDLTKDFGDPTEGLLAHALNYVTTGNYGVNLKIQSTTGVATEPKDIGGHDFNGMLMDKPVKIKK